MVDKFVEWDRDRLVVAQGDSDGNRARFRLVSILDRKGETTDTLALVDDLKKLFPIGTDRKRSSVAVVFPRQMVTIHRIQLPQVPDAEVAAMIRLQASMRLTVPIEGVCMDYTPLPVQPGSATRDVLVVTVPNEQVALARRTLDDAGLDLAEVRVSAYCVAQAAANAGILNETAEPGKVDIVAVMRRDFIELTFVRGTSVVFSHSGSSWTSPDSIERTIRSELTRARMSAAEILGDHRIDRVVLIGAPEITAAVTDQISTRLDGARIERVDPSEVFISGKLPDGISTADVVTLAGAMTCSGRFKVETVDLINPRKPPEKKDLRRIKVLGGCLAALLVFAAVYVWRDGRIRALSEAKALVDGENSEIREVLTAGDDILKQAGKVGDWTARDIPWLDELVKLQALLPGTDRLFVDNFQLMSVPRDGIGSIKLEGFARSAQDVDNLARRLRESGYGVKPFKHEFRASAVSQDYGVKVLLEVSLPETSQSSQRS